MNFIFISKEDEYFIGDAKLISDCTDWTPNTIIDDGWGLFEGKTMVSYKDYKGDLPRGGYNFVRPFLLLLIFLLCIFSYVLGFRP